MINFNLIKANFISFLEKNNLIDEEETTSLLENDISLFAYINEFKDYLEQEAGVDESIFSMNITDIQNLDFENGQFNFDEESYTDLNNGTFSFKTQGASEEDLNFFADTMNDLIGSETILNLFNADETSDLNSNEINEMMNLLSTLDGENSDISLNDLTSLKELIDTGIITTLDDLKAQVAASQNVDSISDTEGVDAITASGSGEPLTRQNTHASNYTNSTGELKSTTQAKELDEINNQISQKNQEIIEQNNKKAELRAADTEYTQMVGQLNQVISATSTCTKNISTYENELHNIQFDITATQTELDSLQDAVLFDEYQPEIDARRQELTSQISNLKQQEIDKQKQLDDERTKLNGLNKEQTSLEEQIKTYEELNPNAEIDQINKNIEILKSDINVLQNKKAEKEKEIKAQREKENTTDEDKKEQCDAYIYGKAQAHRQSDLVKFMLDYATDPETKQYYDKWYFENFNGKAYCAVFTSNVVELLYAKAAEKMGLSNDKLKSLMANSGDTNSSSQGVTGMQMAMNSSVWGNKIQDALNNAGINLQATVDISKMTQEERQQAVREGKIYPGMIFTYSEPYHTGFIESINKDLSWNTIEGNTSVRYSDGRSESHTVGAHTTNATRKSLTAVADPAAKVLYWMYKMGYSIEDISRLLYNK